MENDVRGRIDEMIADRELCPGWSQYPHGQIDDAEVCRRMVNPHLAAGLNPRRRDCGEQMQILALLSDKHIA